jgi:hypothetical protein
MRALVKSRAEPGLWLEDVPEPEYGINDVLIRVHRTGICGTDVAIWKWYTNVVGQYAPAFPLIVALAFALLAEAMVVITLARSWKLSWWEWHLLMGIAFALVAVAARRQIVPLRKGQGSVASGARSGPGWNCQPV